MLMIIRLLTGKQLELQVDHVLIYSVLPSIEELTHSQILSTSEYYGAIVSAVSYYTSRTFKFESVTRGQLVIMMAMLCVWFASYSQADSSS
jgi:hypothetical protein